MPDIGTKAEDLFTTIKDYVNTSVELWKLKMIEKLVVILSSAVSSILLTGIFSMVIFLLSIGVSLYVGRLLGAAYYGFLIVSGVYLLVGIILLVVRKRLLKTPLSNWLIKNLMD